MDRWSGKVAVITGASSGIGADVVHRLVGEGLHVVGLARRKEIIEDMTKKLKNSPGKLYAVKCDISKENDVLNAFQWIKNNIGPIQILINCAAFVASETITEGSTSSWRQILDTNIFGLTLCSREAISQMREHNLEGHLVHINSMLGHRIINCDPPTLNLYPSCKYALTALNEVLSQEMKHYKMKIRSTVRKLKIFHSLKRECVELILEERQVILLVKSKNISPGVVHNTNIFQTGNYEQFSPEVLAKAPHLLPSDVSDAIVYALSTPHHVEVQDIILKPSSISINKI